MQPYQSEDGDVIFHPKRFRMVCLIATGQVPQLSRDTDVLLSPIRFYLARLIEEHKEFYRNQIVRESGLYLDLIKYHLNKMKKTGFVEEVGYKTITVQNRPMPVLFYRRTKKLAKSLAEIRNPLPND